jgi:hypothetical protein
MIGGARVYLEELEECAGIDVHKQFPGFTLIFGPLSMQLTDEQMSELIAAIVAADRPRVEAELEDA